MAKYRKKPVVIDAERTSVLLHGAKDDWGALPDWFVKAYENGVLVLLAKSVQIKTLEGTMTSEKDDWVIRGVQGEIYSCKPDIFEQTYEAA